MISFCIKENNINLQDFLITEINNSNFSNIKYSTHSFKLFENLIIQIMMFFLILYQQF